MNLLFDLLYGKRSEVIGSNGQPQVHQRLFRGKQLDLRFLQRRLGLLQLLTGNSALFRQRPQAIDIHLLHAASGDRLQHVGLSPANFGRVHQRQNLAFANRVADFFLHAPNRSVHAAGQMRGVGFVVHDLTVGGHGFDQRLLIDDRNINAGLFDRLDRGKLNPPLIVFAMAVVFHARQKRQSSVGTIHIVAGHRRNRFQLRHLRVMQRALRDAVLGTSRNLPPLAQVLCCTRCRLLPARYVPCTSHLRRERHCSPPLGGFPLRSAENFGSVQSVRWPQ